MKRAVLTASIVMVSAAAHAQVIDPFYACGYTFRDLGTPENVPTSLGGLVFLRGENNTLLIGGAANAGAGAIYRIGVTRGANNRITGFAGPATLFAAAPNIDGGLDYAPNGVLFFSRYSMNEIGQIKPGSTAADRIVELTPLGFTSSVGAFAFVPPGFPGAGRFKVAPYNSGVWHDAGVTLAVDGTYDISAPTNSILIGGGPEGIVFIEAGSTQFPAASVLVSEFIQGRVSAYEINAQGDPIVATRRSFITNLGGAEGGTRDPVTGDFLFSTFGGGNRVIVVSGFNRGCFANFNGDCAVDINDFFAFLAAYANNNPRCDVNGDSAVDINDFFEYLVRYANGC